MLIFLDEIQELERGLSSLKYFCEDAPEYHIVVAGSLLGLKMSNGTGYLVGKVDTLKMSPLSFKEFLIANGKEEVVMLIEEHDWDNLSVFKN